jgi:site-specific recombinase XerD
MSRRYPGVREIAKGKVYEVNYQIAGERKQYRIPALSEKEAYLKKISDMAEHQKKVALPEEDRQRLTADFSEIWDSLEGDLVAENKLIKKTRGRYRNTYWRMFGDFREKYFPHVKSSKDLTLPFFRGYRNYYANDLKRPGGLRSELIHVKAIMKRLYMLGHCSKELLESLKELKKPPAKKKAYPEISKSDIERLLSAIKKERPDYYALIYFIKRVGRRINESTLIEKKDVILNGFKPVAINIRAEITKRKEKAPLTYLDEDLERHIRRALSNNRTKWLFPNKLDNRCTPNRVREHLKGMSKKVLGIALTPHFFRHRFCTECGKANVPIADVKAISGIRDTKVLLEFYSHSTETGLKQVLEITR